jgi:hypothetical protein
MSKKDINDSPAHRAAEPTSNPLESAHLETLPWALKAAHVHGSLVTVVEAQALNARNRDRYNDVIEGNKALEQMLTSKLESLLPSDDWPRRDIQSRRHELTKRSTRILNWLDRQYYDLEKIEDIKRANHLAQSGYPVLDWRTFLAWKTDQGYPALVVRDALSGGDARLGVCERHFEVSLGRTSTFSDTLRRFYCGWDVEPVHGVQPDDSEPIPWLFRSLDGGTVEIRVSGELAGALPEEISARVRAESKTGKWDDVLFLLEPQVLKIGRYEKYRVGPASPKDILVLGRIGEYLFLITECRLLDMNEYPSLKKVPYVYNGIDVPPVF